MSLIKSSSATKNNVCTDLLRNNKNKMFSDLEDECDFVEQEPSALMDNKTIHSSKCNQSINNVLVCNKGMPLVAQSSLRASDYKQKVHELFSEDAKKPCLDYSFHSDDILSKEEEEYSQYITRFQSKPLSKQSSIKKSCIPSVVRIRKRLILEVKDKEAPATVRSNGISSPELMRRLLR